MVGERRPIGVEDLYNIVTVSDPQISPDGKWVAYVQVTIDELENSYKRNIWLSPTAGGSPRQLTRSGKDYEPRWSPDGKTLAFTSARGDKPQIYLLSMEIFGGEARPLTNMPNGAHSFAWSPDGTRIAFLSPMSAEERAKEDAGEDEKPPKDKLEAKQRKERREDDEKKQQDPYHVWRIPYRVGTSFLTDRYAQIYLTSVAENLAKDTTQPLRLTNMDANHEAPKWSPDGQYIYTGRPDDATQDIAFMFNWIYRIRVEDGSIQRLTDDTHGSFGALPSPDGKWIAYIRLPHIRKGVGESIARLAIMPANDDKSRDLNLELDRSVGGGDGTNVKWSSDSKTIIFIAGDRGGAPIYRVDVNSGEIKTLFDAAFKSLAIDAGAKGELVFTASTPHDPSELYWLSPDTAEAKPITSFNENWLAEVIVQETQEMWFTTPSGQRIQGWYILPVGYEEGKKYPLALNIHGGPRSMWGPNENTLFHEWQCHAARGYVVFYCNPRGSDGYGEAFQQNLHAAWGDVAFADIMAGVDTLLEKGFVDKTRMVVTGGSYGGYMTAWIVGHTSRFVAAVAQRGVYNLVSFYGTTDIPHLISSDFDVDPWEDPELLWKHSPLAYAHRIKTPLLILHSENDYRVPIEQAEQLFAFVRRSGGVVEMFRFPRDGHELSRSGEPEHRICRLTKMVEWFDKYCKVNE